MKMTLKITDIIYTKFKSKTNLQPLLSLNKQIQPQAKAQHENINLNN